MPFTVVDLSELAERATLRGHSGEVWRGVFSCFSACVIFPSLGFERRRLPRRPARRLRVARQDGQGVGRGHGRVRRDAGRAFELGVARCPRFFGFDLPWLLGRERRRLPGRPARRLRRRLWRLHAHRLRVVRRDS